MTDYDYDEEFVTTEEYETYQTLYGDINRYGVEYLREHYDTLKARQAYDLLRSACFETNALTDDIKQIYSAASHIVDQDTFSATPYDLELHGDLGWHVDDVRSRLAELEEKIDAARILLAPLERLISIDKDAGSDEKMLVAYDEEFEPRILNEDLIN